MKNILAPLHFDGKLFSDKYNINMDSFYIHLGYLYYDETITGILEKYDLLDCISNTEKTARVIEREIVAKQNAKNIPRWATWDEATALIWFNDNLSDEIIDSFQIPNEIKDFMKTQNLVIKNLGRIIIALRDKTWPDLPEE